MITSYYVDAFVIVEWYCPMWIDRHRAVVRNSGFV